MITIKEVIIQSDTGSEISTAIREATILALQEKRDVTLTHNKKEFKIIPSDILNMIYIQNENKDETK